MILWNKYSKFQFLIRETAHQDVYSAGYNTHSECLKEYYIFKKSGLSSKKEFDKLREKQKS